MLGSPKSQLTFSPLGPESPLRPGSPGGPCRRGERVNVLVPVGSSAQLYRHRDTACHSPWGRVDHRGLGILGGLAHPETESVGVILCLHQHLSLIPGLTGHLPQDQGSHEDHQGQASQGPLEGQWGQSSQEGLLSQLLPAEEDACVQRLKGSSPQAPGVLWRCSHVS